jgi:hypothetical protein
MLRISRSKKSRISDRLAIFAALLLVVASLAGMSNSVMSSTAGNPRLAKAVDAAQVGLQSSGNSAAKKNRNFKVSLLLVRNH